MQVQVNFVELSRTQAIDDHVQERVDHAVERFADRVTRVEVHLHDENGHGHAHGVPKRCIMEARLAGHKPMVVEHADEDLYQAITECANKLHRAVEHWIDRHAK